MQGRPGTALIVVICALAVGVASSFAAALARPGARSNPIPLRQEASVRETWLMKVVSVTPNADDLVRKASKGSSRARVPTGKEDYLVRLSVMYVGAGRGALGDVLDYIETMGRAGRLYDSIANGCPGTWPSPSFQEAGHRHRTVIPSTWHKGNLCYLAASEDAASLRMFVYPIYPPSTELSRTMWFALR
jgi:hypothetical protein